MDEWRGRKREPVTEERLARAVAILAEIVEEHGPAYGVLYDTVKQQLADFRRLQEDTGGQISPVQERQDHRRVA